MYLVQIRPHDLNESVKPVNLYKTTLVSISQSFQLDIQFNKELSFQTASKYLRKSLSSNNIHDHGQDFSPKPVSLEVNFAEFSSLAQPKDE